MKLFPLHGALLCSIIGLHQIAHGMQQQQMSKNPFAENSETPQQLLHAPAYIKNDFFSDNNETATIYPAAEYANNQANNNSKQTQTLVNQSNAPINAEKFEISSSPSFFVWLSIETSARTHGYSATYTPYLESKTLVTMAQKHFNLSKNTLDQLILQKKLSEIADRVVRDDTKKAIELNAKKGIAVLKRSLELINANKIILGNRARELLKATAFCLQQKEYENIQAFQSLASCLTADNSKTKTPKPFTISIQEVNNGEQLVRKQLIIQFSNTLNQENSSFFIQVPSSFKTKKQDLGWFNTGFVSKLYRKVQEKINGYADSYVDAIDNGILDKTLEISEYCQEDLTNIMNIIQYLGELITVEHVASNVVNDLAHKVSTACLHGKQEQDKDNCQEELTNASNLQRCLLACKNQNYPISPVVAKILNETIKTIQQEKLLQASTFNSLNEYLLSIIKNSENPIHIAHDAKHENSAISISESSQDFPKNAPIPSNVNQPEQQQEQL